MKETGLLFRGEMVRALLDGRKTMTRRLKGLEYINQNPDAWELHGYGSSEGDFCAIFVKKDESESIWVACPYGGRGDRLWVRETYWVNCAGNTDGSGKDIIYRADDPNWPYGWRPSIFMPRWASRIALEITNVRVERLQEITERDAKAEGVTPYMGWNDIACCNNPFYAVVFKDIWDFINGKKSPWESNPWVWVIEFKRT